MKKVMITGIGMLTAVGNGREASWANIKAGKPGIGKITKFDASRCTCQVAAEVKGFDEWAIGGGLLDKREARLHGKDEYTGDEGPYDVQVGLNCCGCYFRFHFPIPCFMTFDSRRSTSRSTIRHATCDMLSFYICYPIADGPRSPVLILTHSSIGRTKIFPSPMSPVRAPSMIASIVLSM